MKKTIAPLFLLFVLVLWLAWAAVPAAASPQFQLTPFPTPTAQDDGRIIYIVQPGDTLWRIAAVSGISLDELRQLNNLTADDVITDGQQIFLGLGGPAAATPLPQSTAVDVTPLASPTFGPSSGTICVLVYQDINGDAIRQTSENAMHDAEVSVTERLGAFSEARSTQGSLLPEEAAPVCFEEIPVGEYNISVAVPQGFNATTPLTINMDLEAGTTVQLNFGGQPGAQAVNETLPPEEGGRNPLLGVIGLAVILVGIGLGVLSTRIGR